MLMLDYYSLFNRIMLHVSTFKDKLPTWINVTCVRVWASLCGKEIGIFGFRLGSCSSSFIFRQHSHADWGQKFRERNREGIFVWEVKYEILFRGWKIREQVGNNVSDHRYKDTRRNGVNGERREKARRGRNDGILSELNWGVKGRDGSVNSNKSHLLCLYVWLVTELWTEVKVRANG